MPEAARHLAMSDKALANWVFRAQRGQLAKRGESRRPMTNLEAEVARLQRELVEARMERDILKSHRALCEGAAARYALMMTLRSKYPVSLLCQVLGVSRSGYSAGSTSVRRTAPRRMRGWKGDPRRPCAHAADLWTSASPGGMA